MSRDLFWPKSFEQYSGESGGEIDECRAYVEIHLPFFSLPEAQTKHVIDKRHASYDEAHQNGADCMEKFVHCPDSIWSAGFKLIEINAIKSEDSKN